MWKRSITKKVEVTVNDSGFDNPSGGTIEKEENAASRATLTFPSIKGRHHNYFLPDDIVKIYVGMDELPSEPTFVGEVISERGEETIEFSLQSLTHRLSKDYLVISDLGLNFDGWEAGMAMKCIVEGHNGLGISNINPAFKFFGGTKPKVILQPSMRYSDGIDRMTLIRNIVNSCFDITNYPNPPLAYSLCEVYDPVADDTILYLRKLLDLDDVVPWWTFKYFDVISPSSSPDSLLISSDPYTKTLGTLNEMTVVGKDGIHATYVNAHRQTIDGIQSRTPFSSNKLTTRAMCYEVARQEVESNLNAVENVVIHGFELLDAVPGLTVIEVVGGPSIINGNHRVRSVYVDFSSEGFDVNAIIDNKRPTFMQMLKARL